MQKSRFIFLVVAAVCACAVRADDNIDFSLLWSGSFKDAVTPNRSPLERARLSNRADLRINLPYNLTTRFQITDRRDGIIFGEDPLGKPAFTDPGAGLYYASSGDGILGPSRLVWGNITEYGLKSRVSNVWAKSVPFFDSRIESGGDLRTEATTSGSRKLFASISGGASFVTGFAQVAFDEGFNGAYTAGAAFTDGAMQARLEGFYTANTNPAKTQTSWFPAERPLPERDYAVHAAAFSFTYDFFSFAADGAYSCEAAVGDDVYLSGAVRLKPGAWRLDFAADGAGEAFTGPDGKEIGSGFRTGARAERKLGKGKLLSFKTVLSSPGVSAPFDRGEAGVAYSAKAGKSLSLSRASLGFSRDARIAKKIVDKVTAKTTVDSGHFSGSLGTIFTTGPFFAEFISAKYSGDFSFSPGDGMFTFRLRGAATVAAKKDTVWSAFFGTTVKIGKRNRFAAQIGWDEYPDKWSYSFSWRAVY